MTADPLPSWRPGPTRDALLAFLDRSATLPMADRFACLDNDGTLWTEKPTYLQWDFFVDALARRAEATPALAEREEYAAVLSADREQMAAFGLPRIALALAELFEAMPPEEFLAEARAFVQRARHPTLGRPVARLLYQPMLELIAALRARDFTVAIVTGGGTDFVRAVSEELYGVPPELVVGTTLEHDVVRLPDGSPALRRTAGLLGAANEGDAKVSAIWSHFGRRPLLAAGNSAGDGVMLEWAAASPDGFALLVDHDDAAREFAYASESASLTEVEPITTTAARLGWVVASMARDWAVVLAD